MQYIKDIFNMCGFAYMNKLGNWSVLDLQIIAF